MRSFDQFLAVLNEIPDPRRAEGSPRRDGLSRASRTEKAQALDAAAQLVVRGRRYGSTDAEELERLVLDGGWPGDDGERIVGRDCRGDGVASAVPNRPAAIGNCGPASRPGSILLSASEPRPVSAAPAPPRLRAMLRRLPCRYRRTASARGADAYAIPGNRPACRGRHARGPDRPTDDRPAEPADRQSRCSERRAPRRRGIVAAHRRRIVEDLLRQAGADDIDAVGCRLGGDRGGLACEAEGGIGDIEMEVFAILCLLITLPTASAMLAVRAATRLRATAAWIGARSRLVAASRSSRLRVAGRRDRGCGKPPGARRGSRVL